MSEVINQPNEASQRFLSRHRSVLVVVVHAGLVALALLGAFLLAYNFRLVLNEEGQPYIWFLKLYLPLVALALPIKLLVFGFSGQYRGSWRYVGLRDVFDVVSASLIGTFVFLAVYFLLENFWSRAFGVVLIDGPPGPALKQVVFVLDWAATIVFVAGARILVRFYYEDIQPQRLQESFRRVLIVGASDSGEAVLRELLRSRRERYVCVGFLDDAVAQLHGRIHGVEVLGRTGDIREICAEHKVEEVLIALPDATPKSIRLLVEPCEGLGVKFRTIPAVSDVIEGRVQVSKIRDVEIADLLGRDPIELDLNQIGAQLRGQVVAVTGAGGSIGSELCRQVASFEPARLVLIEQAENSLFEIDQELRRTHQKLNLLPYVCDVTDKCRVEYIFAREHPYVVFHAAAHKHVPMMECNPGEAIKNNINGTKTVADAAQSCGIKKMVIISTDKAVNPTSMMGATKRVAEKYVQCLTSRATTQYVTVRFGNVLGSSGSVVPIFREQIRVGGPVTVTHPDMVRYFMTIPEASQLVLQAGAMGKGGEIYVLHMGEPVKIVDLARDMITLSGLKPGIDIEISFSGKRPGEKLFEELSYESELIGDTAHAKIGIWKLQSEDFGEITTGIDRLMKLADGAEPGQIRNALKEMVPEYAPETGDASPASAKPLEGETDKAAAAPPM